MEEKRWRDRRGGRRGVGKSEKERGTQRDSEKQRWE